MDFSEQYLTYDEYVLMGGTLDKMPFDIYEIQARTNIDRQTQRRLKDITKIPMEVKVCIFNIIQGLAFDGGYKDANADEKEKYINNLIFNSLNTVIVNGTNILYRGVI